MEFFQKAKGAVNCKKKTLLTAKNNLVFYKCKANYLKNLFKMQILSFTQQITASFCSNSIDFIEVKANEIFDKKC